MKPKEILQELLGYSNLNAKAFSEAIGLDRPQAIYDIQKGKTRTISDNMANKIISEFSEINRAWLLTGEGGMFKNNQRTTSDKEEENQGNVIPFYDDVSSIGGINSIVADMSGVSIPSDYIDTGDWFRDATAAIRHYGESMIEYPSGCILAIKEVLERMLIIPGRDYVIETNEYRVTKKIQLNKDSIRAHSTNTETYPDGSLIHQPFDIPFESINRIFLVLGYVVKKNGGTIVYSNKTN